jgi:hypothetical protein
MAEFLEGLDLTDSEKYLLDLRAHYDEQLKENEECRQRLLGFAELRQRMSAWVEPPRPPEGPPVCRDFRVKITPYLLEESRGEPPS